jgi:hypothetical protein
MTVDQTQLHVESNNIYDSEDTLIATINALVPQANYFARLFSSAPQLLTLLESVLTDQANEFDQTRKSADEFNKRPGLSPGSLYGRNLTYAKIPSSLQNGLELLAHIKSSKN